MITKLTKKQEKQIQEYVEKYIKIAFSTGPSPRGPETKEMIAKIYKEFKGQEAPKQIIHVKSPLEAWKKIKELYSNDDIGSFCWPYLDGSYSANVFAYYDFMREVMGIKFENSHYDLWKQTINYGMIFTLDDVCVISDKAEKISYNENFDFHCDGAPAFVYGGDDPIEFYRLNRVDCPKWLVMTAAEDIDPMKIHEITNAEVRREFVRKVGLDRIVHKLGGKIIDTEEIQVKTPHNPDWVCKYELLEVNYGNNTKRRVLKMPNPSMEGIFHVEYVPIECETVRDAMNFRLNRTEDEIDDKNGTEWYMQGDVYVVPKGATKVKRWPSIMA